MPYRIRHKDPAAEATVRRIAREQVHGALRSLDGAVHAPVAAIHDVRKRCKKVRGLLRLARPVFDDYRAENAAFRDMAAQLGALRDAEVLVDAFDHVVEGLDTPAADALAPIRDQLCLRRFAVASERDLAVSIRAARDGLEAALERIDGWRLADDGFDAFEGGLQASYRQGRKAMRAACRTGNDEAFHTWRKRCKDHAFHLRLLRPILPGPMRAQYICAAELGELLGLHHDLAVLASSARVMPDVESDAIQRLLGHVAAQQHALAQRAELLGARLHADRPSALADSWRRRYRAWERPAKGASTAGG